MIGPKSSAARADRRDDGALAAVLSVLTICGPISTSVHLPALPALADDLGATTSIAQLTVTTCLLGLGVGQLVVGPLSDRFGRRRPLLIGLCGYILASALCAASPTVELLIASRFLQGCSGAVGLVVAHAAGRDLYIGPRLVRYYGRLAVLGGLAAVIGPVLGGLLLSVTSWRGVFVLLAVAGLGLLIAAIAVAGETLPATRRRPASDRSRTRRDLARLLSDTRYVGFVAITGLGQAAIYAFSAAGSFVLQVTYELSPAQYSWAFGANSAGYMAFGYIGSRLAARWSSSRAVGCGLLLSCAGAAGILHTGVAHGGLAAMLISSFAMVAGVALATPATMALAMSDHPGMAGTASSLLGVSRFGLGAAAAPLVGVAGASTAIPVGMVTVAAITTALVVHLLLVRPRPRLSASRWPMIEPPV